MNTLSNKNIAVILEEIGVMVELSGGNPFKARAYYSAARNAETLDKPITGLVSAGKLGDIRGFGKGIVEKITELIQYGKIREQEELRASIPDGLFDMLRIQGLGPKKVRSVYEKLDIKTVGELEYACRENRLTILDGFGTKSQENILKGIELLKKFHDRFLYPAAEKAAKMLLNAIRSLQHVTRADIAGSLRRKKETVKNIDLVASVNEQHRSAVMEIFTSLPQVDEILVTGSTQSSVCLAEGMNAVLRLVNDNQYPFAFHYFTGSKEYNTAMQQRAKSISLNMNEYGISHENRPDPVTCKNEEDIFRILELPYIEPELRENLGEIESAAEGSLPCLITEKDIKGILHVHTTYSDGKNTLEEMVRGCMDTGFEYIGICDHSKTAFYANGLTEERIIKQHKEIDNLREKYPGFKIFKGIESDILTDGSLDYSDEVLAQFDFIVASVHSKLSMPQDEATARIKRAVLNPCTTILGHPTGRLLLSREGYSLDWDEIFNAAFENNVAIELNAHPQRLDIDWRMCRRAKELSIKIAINPDAHETEGFFDLAFGTGAARKGWLEARDVISTLNAVEMEEYFRNRKSNITKS